ncbi:MAG: CDP-diacylglycerol--glycerol-3-phosphate 3-phosphatidyltransferase [Myxococcales bacterium]|nr:CDP-diacylglycerol--glycerol-3-phosphate 3-phosphatidyltransferase [Myxococcales bacterium]
MKSLKRSVLTSLFTTALDFGTLTALVELFHVNYVIATFFGTVVGSLSNFFINRHWAFEARAGAAHWQIARFLPVQAGSSGLQTLGVWLFTEHTELRYFTSKLVVAVIVYLVWNYPMNRFFVFPHRKQSVDVAKSSSLSI